MTMIEKNEKKTVPTKQALSFEFFWIVGDKKLKFDNSSIFTRDKISLRNFLEGARHEWMEKGIWMPFYVSWKYKDKEIVIMDKSDEDKNSRIHSLAAAIPTPDFRYVLVIFDNHDNNGYNGVLYNLDGTIKYKLRHPKKLMSVNAKENSFFCDYQDCYWQYRIEKEKKEICLTIKCRFDIQFWEDRILNVETGEFEELVDWGRY